MQLSFAGAGDGPVESLRQPLRPRMAEYLSGALSWDSVLLLAIIVASFALRWYRIDDALTGFHAFNEGFYTDLGRRYLEDTFMAPFSNPLDSNNPPLYAFVLRAWFAVVGVSLAAARSVSVIASTVTIVAVYLLGKELYGTTAGLVAATIFGLSPGSVLVGGNAQTEGLMVLLRVSAILAYVRGAKTRDLRYFALAGALLGLALLTKLPALVVPAGLAVWETWGCRGLSWVRRRRTAVFYGAVAATALPWYLVRTLGDQQWRAGQAGLIRTFELPSLETVQIWLGSELFWLVSPVVFIAFLFAIGLLAKRHEAADVLVLSLLAANIVFYLFYSYHTYYLLPAVPLVAVAVGSLVETLGFGGMRKTVAVVTVLALVLSVFAAVIVGGKKWGGWYASDVRDIVVHAGYAPEHIVLAVDADILDSWRPAIEAAFPDTLVLSYPLASDVTLPADMPVLHLAWHEQVQSEDDPTTVPHRRHGPVFFGHTVQLPATLAVHHFGVVDAEIVRVGPPWWFGVTDSVGPTRLRVEVLRP